MVATLEEIPVKTESLKVLALKKAMALMESLIPLEFEVSQLAIICNLKNVTLRKHLYLNYKEGEDYYQKVKNGKIVIARPCALKIKEHYAK